METKLEKRKTVQQQLIFEAVKELNMHASAEQIMDYLAQKYPTIGRATVYRNLNYLSETGKLLRVGNFYGTTHYDHNCHKHYHFICDNCKQIFDVEGSIDDIVEKFNGTRGFDIAGYSLSFSGLCWECKS